MNKPERRKTPRKRVPELLSDQVRRAMNEHVESGAESRYAIARATGISESALSRFASGERGLQLINLDKLVAHLGLYLQTSKPRNVKTSR